MAMADWPGAAAVAPWPNPRAHMGRWPGQCRQERLGWEQDTCTHGHGGSSHTLAHSMHYRAQSLRPLQRSQKQSCVGLMLIFKAQASISKVILVQSSTGPLYSADMAAPCSGLGYAVLAPGWHWDVGWRLCCGSLKLFGWELDRPLLLSL